MSLAQKSVVRLCSGTSMRVHAFCARAAAVLIRNSSQSPGCIYRCPPVPSGASHALQLRIGERTSAAACICVRPNSTRAAATCSGVGTPSAPFRFFSAFGWCFTCCSDPQKAHCVASGDSRTNGDIHQKKRATASNRDLTSVSCRQGVSMGNPWVPIRSRRGAT